MDSSAYTRSLSTEASSSPLDASPLHSYIHTLIPSFNIPHFHKGDHGKIAIVGGSFEYTGAPYYSGIAALKTGADLVWVICSKDAGLPIKAYSPELIVHPILPDTRTEPKEREHVFGTVQQLVNRVDAIVIGPGLGRDEVTLQTIERMITEIYQPRAIPLVLDGDALCLLSLKPHLLQNYTSVVFLTPNVVEFRRLWEAVYAKDEPIPESSVNASARLIEKYGKSVGILRKGEKDTIVLRNGSSSSSFSLSTTSTSNSSGSAPLIHDQVYGTGSPRRCGGQGDILAGTLGTFLAWGQRAVKMLNDTPLSPPSSLSTTTDRASAAEIYAASARGAALLTRNAAKHAFAQHKRSMTTPDILANIGTAFEELYPNTLYQLLPNENEDD